MTEPLVDLLTDGRIAAIDATVGRLLAPVRSLVPAERLAAAQIALTELLANAVEHGTLGVTGAEKRALLLAGGRAALAARCAERLRDPAVARRRIRATLTADAESLEWRIRDEGDGFAAAEREPAADEATPPGDEAAAEPGGRGIALARALLDGLRYEEGGRVAVARLRIRETAPVGQP